MTDHGLLRGNELSDELNDEREEELDDEAEPSDDCRELYADMLLDLAALIDELALLAAGVPENGSTGRAPPSGSIGAVVGARGAGVVVDGLIGVGAGAVVCAKPIPVIAYSCHRNAQDSNRD